MKEAQIMKKGLLNRTNVIYLIATAFLILMISLMAGKTVYSMEKNDSRGQILNGYTGQTEAEYTEQVRKTVNEMGYRNAGIMLSVVVDGDGIRNYTLRINHRKLNDESSSGITRKNELIKALGRVPVIMEDSTVEIVICDI